MSSRLFAKLVSTLAVPLFCLGGLYTKTTAKPLPKTAPQQEARVPAPAFPNDLQWLNTDKPITLASLQGKVVLLDFWTYCCINCIHTIPDLKKLEAKFPNELVVIGVHSAKFENEKEAQNIRQAILRYEIEHPVVNDRDFQFWRAYGVQSWPTLVLIDPAGKAVGMAAGEGHYDVLEQKIGELAKEFQGKMSLQPIKWALEKYKRAPSILSFPGKVVGDEKSGRLFFTDSNHNRIFITSLDGAIQEVIGSGKIGLKDGDYETAQLFRPQGICYDPTKDLLYVTDTNNHALRKVNLKTKRVTTVVGNGRKGGYPPTGGMGNAGLLASPWDVVMLKDRLYIANAGTHQLWQVQPETRMAQPFAGTGGENILDGARNQALLAQPSGITTNGTNLFFADSEVSAVRYVDIAKGVVNTLIGQGLFEFGDIDGTNPKARLQHPLGVAYHDNFIYVADTYNHKIKRIDVKTKVVETYIGAGKRGNKDGNFQEAEFNEPNGMAFVGNKLYITDTNNHSIRVVDLKKQTVTTLKLSGLEKVPTL